MFDSNRVQNDFLLPNGREYVHISCQYAVYIVSSNYYYIINRITVVLTSSNYLPSYVLGGVAGEQLNHSLVEQVRSLGIITSKVVIRHATPRASPWAWAPSIWPDLIKRLWFLVLLAATISHLLRTTPHITISISACFVWLTTFAWSHEPDLTDRLPRRSPWHAGRDAAILNRVRASPTSTCNCLLFLKKKQTERERAMLVSDLLSSLNSCATTDRHTTCQLKQLVQYLQEKGKG
jgi:hypothetical protein